MASHRPNDVDPAHDEREDEDAMLDADDAGEEIEDIGGDVAMDSDDEDDAGAPLAEIQLQNDSKAHFDKHTDSIFCIAQHPTRRNIVATGGGDDVAYLWDSASTQQNPVLPSSWQSGGAQGPGGAASGAAERQGIEALQKLDGHTDSVNALAFSRPNGEYLLTAGLDGRLRAWHAGQGTGTAYKFLAEAQEVEEINWLAASPAAAHPNTFALGANDGSVWVYTVDAADAASPLTIVQTYYLHQAPSTAGAWTPDGNLLATVAEDSSLYVWDVFGDAATAGVTDASSGGQTVVGLTAADQRFEVEGGLYSVSVAPNGAFVAVGGAGGHVRIVSLPRLGSGASATQGQKGAGARSKAGAGGRQAGGKAGAGSTGQAGQILASLQPQGDSVEAISFSPNPAVTLMATASVDGSIALFDWAHNFAVRRHIKEAHEGEAVIKVEFEPRAGSTVLLSCGNDGVLRSWDARGGTVAAGQGLLKEWRGHQGGGDGGGILGFVQDGAGTVVTAGDEGVALVFTT